MNFGRLLPVLALMFLFGCQPQGPRMALIETEMGNMTLKLYDETPQHRDNFVKLVEEGFYDDLLFHRVIKNFMIQGGDPDSKDAAPGQRLGNGGPGYTIPAEFNPNIIHTKGKLAAARTDGPQNPNLESSGCQFYIVQGFQIKDFMLDQVTKDLGTTYTEEQKQEYYQKGGAPNLDMKYTIFGEVTEGLEVIDKIANVQRDRYDRPNQDIRMKIRMLN